MKNIVTLGKLIGLLLLFHLLFLLFILFQPLNVHIKNTRNELARPVKGTIFLV